MPVRYVGNPPVALSYNDFVRLSRAQVVAPRAPAVAAPAPHIVVEQQALPFPLNAKLAVKFVLRNADGTDGPFTSSQIIDNPNAPLSAATIAKWCKPLGIDPTTMGVDDTW